MHLNNSWTSPEPLLSPAFPIGRNDRVAASRDGIIWFYAKSGFRLANVRPAYPIAAFVVNTSMDLMAVAHEGTDEVHVRETSKGDLQQTLFSSGISVKHLSFIGDRSQYLLGISETGDIVVWDWMAGTRQFEYSIPMEFVHAAKLRVSGTTFILGGIKPHLALLDPLRGKDTFHPIPIPSLSDREPVTTIATARYDLEFYYGTPYGNIGCIALSNEHQRWSNKINCQVYCLHHDIDNHSLLAGGAFEGVLAFDDLRGEAGVPRQAGSRILSVTAFPYREWLITTVSAHPDASKPVIRVLSMV